MKERYPGDHFAYTLTVIDQSARDRQLKAFLLTTIDALGGGVSIPHLGRGPESFSFVTVGPPFNQGVQSVPVPTKVDTCGTLARMPWSAHLNLPFFIQAELLDPALKEKYEAALFWAHVALYAFLTLVVLGLICLPFGFFDKESEREKARARQQSLVRYGVFAVGVAVALHLIRGSMGAATDELVKGQAYYQFYSQLPKTNGLLQPINYGDAQRLFQGPPIPDSMRQSPEIFWLTFLGALIGGMCVFGLRIYKGWYWLFVPLPLEVRFKRALKRGEWPTTDEVMDAVLAGSLNKMGWQSKAMALKADSFARELAARRGALERRITA